LGKIFLNSEFRVQDSPHRDIGHNSSKFNVQSLERNLGIFDASKAITQRYTKDTRRYTKKDLGVQISEVRRLNRDFRFNIDYTMEI